MIASRGMYIRNIAYIPPSWKDIRNTDINELDVIGLRSEIDYKQRGFVNESDKS